MTTAETFDRHLPITGTMDYQKMKRTVRPFVRVDDQAELPDDINGLYDAELETILIDRRLDDIQKRCTLVHELFHWMHADTACHVNGRSPAEARACTETALFLVDPVGYVRAERAYDGEPFLMARELGVSVFVLESYRNVLERDLSRRIAEAEGFDLHP